ncbi:TetR/AcrR family transcriptional regulator [Streptomyces althioticus]|jgi:TetR/AcrR family transcriptional regulator of autoinduction and epiphytic fitness|uniref:TetR/AcrR family transcriptional regulator n=1 Tax=Actinomycetes TaxID=1760 RepID=UPI000526A6AE|nr:MULTISPECIES: TetR/AcrR family transcriptional regulator [Actinomycetes]MBM4827360.1 TetR/AcrR family transcriptional regulator [Actinospica acidiphila]MCC9689456.1 TetR/AcrR family transcriptional regulator [Streptomyces sp. MNU103]WTC21841.1 TetR/AcrR family transcriptional regulator [Streptomyces althioticus]GGQ71215.1 TetR family transcriptional regulator [Streptomyces althioticus]
MAAELSAHHRRLAQRKREAIITAATELFLDRGYDGTSLARIAEAAGVSKSTLFKQFPTKAALFEAIVAESWQRDADDDAARPRTGDLRSGLTAIGRRYADLVGRPGMAALFRIVIAELPRFPELGRMQFQLGKLPYFTSVQQYLEAEHEAGNAEVPDAESAANQFLGMIANYVLWPRMLLTDWNPAASDINDAVDEAVRTMLARYAPDRRPDPKPEA